MDEVMKAFSDVTDKDRTPTEERRPLSGVHSEKSTVIGHDDSGYGKTNGSSKGLESYDAEYVG